MVTCFTIDPSSVPTYENASLRHQQKPSVRKFIFPLLLVPSEEKEECIEPPPPSSPPLPLPLLFFLPLSVLALQRGVRPNSLWYIVPFMFKAPKAIWGHLSFFLSLPILSPPKREGGGGGGRWFGFFQTLRWEGGTERISSYDPSFFLPSFFPSFQGRPCLFCTTSISICAEGRGLSQVGSVMKSLPYLHAETERGRERKPDAFTLLFAIKIFVFLLDLVLSYTREQFQH